MNLKSSLFIVAISLLFNSAFAAPPGITTGKQLQHKAEDETTVINTNDLKQLIESEPELILIDIRSNDEIANMGGTIDAPQNNLIPRGWLEFKTPNIATSKDTPIVVYCGAGVRSPLTAKTLQDMGYTNVKDYKDGFFGWKKAGNAIK